MDIQNTTEQVKDILTNNTAARDSDNLLFYLVCKEELKKEGKDADSIGFAELFLTAFYLPPFETIARIRRKVQKDYPDLCGSRRATRKRAIFENVMREYALEGQGD